MTLTRREMVAGAAASSLISLTSAASAQPAASPGEDRVFICNEDSNTLSIIDPRTNIVEGAVNLTSFDEDPRPPFRFVTGGVAPTHAGMIQKPRLERADRLGTQAGRPGEAASERLTLRYIAQGELHATEMDWVAVQRLKRMGLVEERGGSTMTTKEGQRTLHCIDGST